MTKSLRFGTALSAALLATTLGGCAGSPHKFSSVQAVPVANANAGLATRAQAALVAGDSVQAIDFAQRAVEATPNEPAFRLILGNSYFAGGRFASAEAAYRDSLTLSADQPQVALKLALVSIAQGKNAQGLAFLEAARAVIDPADYGLGLALAGRPQDAAVVLRHSAEQVGADSRVRQNLALALALSGDWAGARSVASQDVSADQLDARIQSWMLLAKPARSSDQLASLTGIAAAASDPGQPLRLALRDDNLRLAAAAPAAPMAEPVPVTVPAETAPVVAETMIPAPVAAPASVAARSVVAVALPPQHRAIAGRPLVAAPIASLAPRYNASAPRPSLSPRAAALTDARTLYRHAALSLSEPRSRAVVQLGAYASRGSVTSAWRHVSGKFSALRGFTPVAARFNGERGTFFRLSVQGFGSARDAVAMCSGLKRAGANCFVRNVAGDAPVRMASR